MCNPVGGSQPLAFKWFKNDHQIGTPSSVNDGGRIQIDSKHAFSQLYVANLMPVDKGNYSCMVSNQAGADRQWSLLNVQGLLLSIVFIRFLAKMWRSSLGVSVFGIVLAKPIQFALLLIT